MTEAEELELLELEEAEAQAKAFTAPKVPTPLNARGALDYRLDKNTQEMGYTPEGITAAANNTAAMMTGGLSRLAPKLGGVVGSALEGGAMGAAQSPDDRLAGFLKGGASQGALSGVAKMAGNVGDRAMQWAVGRKKFTPGVGTELADQGIVGTRGMMKNRVANRLDEVGGKMTEVAGEIPRVINSRKIGREMADDLTAPLTGRGTITPSARDTGTMEQFKDFAQDVSARGAETGTQALARRRAAGSSAYSQKTQDPKLSPIAQASKLEQRKYSEALKAADPRMVPLDKTYGALKRAELPLNQEEAISGFAGLASSAAKTLAQPTASVIGQTGVKGGKLAEFLAPVARQSLVGGARSSGLTPEEEAEYQQLLRESGRR